MMLRAQLRGLIPFDQARYGSLSGVARVELQGSEEPIMRRTTFVGLIVLVLMVVSNPLLAQGTVPKQYWEFKVGVKEFAPEGTIRTNNSDDIGLNSQLEVNDDNTLILAASYKPHNARRFRVRWGKFDFRGENTLSNSITYSGETFSAGSAIETDLDVQFSDVDLEYQLIRTSDKNFLNFTFGGRMMRVDGKIQNSSRKASEKITVASPVIGINFRKDVYSRLYLSGRTSGMDVSLDNDDFSLVDSEIGLTVKTVRDVWFETGYRTYSVDANLGDERVDLEFEGFFANVVLDF